MLMRCVDAALMIQLPCRALLMLLICDAFMLRYADADDVYADADADFHYAMPPLLRFHADAMMTCR